MGKEARRCNAPAMGVHRLEGAACLLGGLRHTECAYYNGLLVEARSGNVASMGVH